MRIRLYTKDGKTPAQGIKDVLKRVLGALRSSGETIGTSMVATTQNHFVRRFGASAHYAPENVTLGKCHGATGVADVNVPGAGRAYHDVTILPRLRTRLTIPLHREAYGREASEFDDLFYVRTQKGTELLGRKDGKGVTWLYVLAKRAFQPQDATIMPTDDELARDAFRNVANLIRRAR